MSEDKKDQEQPKGYTYKYKRLYDLGSDRLNIIESMLTNGDSPATVAEHIQQDWGECTNVKHGTLEKQIHRYRSDVLEPKLLVAAEAAASKGTAVSKQMKKFRDGIDVKEKLNAAIAMQYERIEKAYTKEALKGPDGKLDPTINKELRPFTDMCRALATLQLETGELRRVPKQVQGFFAQLKPEELTEFRLEMEQNDETLKSLGMIKDVLQEAASEIIDGELIPVESESSAVPTGDVEDLETGSH
jgi:hypothetical protein